MDDNRRYGSEDSSAYPYCGQVEVERKHLYSKSKEGTQLPK